MFKIFNQAFLWDAGGEISMWQFKYFGGGGFNHLALLQCFFDLHRDYKDNDDDDQNDNDDADDDDQDDDNVGASRPSSNPIMPIVAPTF